MTIESDVNYILEKFKNKGYKTDKGTNTWVIANIMADYGNLVKENLQKNTNSQNFWTSENFNDVVKLAFHRYRIYNNRHFYGEVEHDENSINLQNFTEYNGTVIVNGVRQVGYLDSFSLGSAKELKEIKLNIDYNNLLCNSAIFSTKRKNQCYFESLQDSNGKFLKRDYLLLPTDDGKTLFTPLIEFEKDEFLILKVITRNPNQFDLIKESFEVTSDYLRYLCTLNLERIKTFNKLDIKSFVNFLQTKYQKSVYVDDKDVYISLSNKDYKEFELFVELNELDCKIKEPKKLFVKIDNYDEYLNELDVICKFKDLQNAVMKEIIEIIKKHNLEFKDPNLRIKTTLDPEEIVEIIPV